MFSNVVSLRRHVCLCCSLIVDKIADRNISQTLSEWAMWLGYSFPMNSTILLSYISVHKYLRAAAAAAAIS